jgi:AraC-like DNA-binding protein
MADYPNQSTLNELWCLRSFGLHQIVDPKGPRWWLTNCGRKPTGVVILQYAKKGKFAYRDIHGEVEIQPGHAVLFAFDEESEYGIHRHFTESLHTQFFVMEGAGLLEHCNALRRQFGSVFFLGDDNPILNRFRELCALRRPRSTAEAGLAAAEIYSLLMRLYTFLDERRSREKLPVERAIDELLSHALGSHSLKEVALRHGCSREHLSRVFAERVGMSPAKYLTHSKLARALELLCETRLPVRLVAEQCGFASKHTLSRWVRTETGRSPDAYRKRR